MFSILSFLLFHLALVFSAIPEHKISSLPGWNGSLPSDQYSGLLSVPNTAPNTRYYHYWLVTSESNPSKDPIVFWFNGGPGASSLLGYFTEQGPFHTNDESIMINTTSVPILFYNQYNWAKNSNIVFLESPAGVGFSYCNGTNGPINSCPDWNDTSVAKDNHDIIQQFFKYYPEYLSNDFYISGESYAGIYVPTLVMQIENDPSGMPPLLGFAVGDGCMGINGYGGCNRDEQEIFWSFMYGHSQISYQSWQEINRVCGNTLHFGNETQACNTLLNNAMINLGGFNIYDIYDMCYLENDEVEKKKKPQMFKNKEGHTRFHMKLGYNGQQLYTDQSGINQYACGGEKTSNIYLNQDEVKQALHVTDIPWTWQDGDWDKYHSTQTDLLPFYVNAAQKYRILIYFGDVDGGVPYNGGEEWTNMMGYPILEAWRPWSIDGAELMAGYVQTFQTNNNFTYATVRGAGHMVPQFKPPEALKLYQSFLSNTRFPDYVGPTGGR